MRQSPPSPKTSRFKTRTLVRHPFENKRMFLQTIETMNCLLKDRLGFQSSGLYHLRGCRQPRFKPLQPSMRKAVGLGEPCWQHLCAMTSSKMTNISVAVGDSNWVSVATSVAGSISGSHFCFWCKSGIWNLFSNRSRPLKSPYSSGNFGLFRLVKHGKGKGKVFF